MDSSDKKKLHIAMVVDAIDYTAGSLVSTRRFAEILQARGHTVTFISSKRPRMKESADYKGMKIYRFRGVLLPFSERSWYLALVRPKTIQKILKDEGVDIVHILIPTPLGISATFAARKLGLKMVAYSHTQPENLFLHFPRWKIVEKINRLFYRYMFWIYTKAHGIIYPSNFAKTRFPELDEVMPTRIVSNGVDTTIFKKVDTGDFHERHGLSRDKKQILYVGRLHPEKSIETLLNAVPTIIDRYPNAHISIVGGGWMDEKLKKVARKTGYSDHISFLGKVSNEDLVLAFNMCDIFVLPSLAELEGMVVLEAMACGKPLVIANAEESAARFFVDDNGLLFDPENSADLADKINTLLEDEDMRLHMANASYAKSKHYDIQQSVNILEELTYTVLAGGDSPAERKRQTKQ